MHIDIWKYEQWHQRFSGKDCSNQSNVDYFVVDGDEGARLIPRGDDLAKPFECFQHGLVDVGNQTWVVFGVGGHSGVQIEETGHLFLGHILSNTFDRFGLLHLN